MANNDRRVARLVPWDAAAPASRALHGRVACSACASAAAQYVCACRGAAYCSEHCQSAHWLGVGAASSAARVAHRVECGAALDLVGAQAAAGRRKKIRRANLPGMQNVFSGLNSGPVTRVQSLRQDLQAFDMFVNLVSATPFWTNNSQTTNPFTVFAPDNDAMVEWLRKIGASVDKATLDMNTEKATNTPLDRDKSLAKFKETYAANTARGKRALTILLAHFIPGVRPLYTGLERGPRPIDKVAPVQRRGLAPLTFLGIDTEWDPVIEELPDPDFFRARFGQVRVIQTRDRTKSKNDVVKADKTGIKVTFVGGNTKVDAEIYNSDEYIFRPRNGYIYRISEVLSNDVDELRPNEVEAFRKKYDRKPGEAPAAVVPSGGGGNGNGNGNDNDETDGGVSPPTLAVDRDDDAVKAAAIVSARRATRARIQ